MVLISESAISEILEHGFNDGLHSRVLKVNDNYNDYENTSDSW